LYQARNILGEDTSGLSDPYIKVRSATSNIIWCVCIINPGLVRSSLGTGARKRPS
jgi:hypothetical protein